MLPENLFQATFQQTHTIYVEEQRISENGTDAKINLIRQLAYRNAPNTLGVVIFCMIFGMAINRIGPKGAIVKSFFSALLDALLGITSRAIWLSGIGVCSIICGKILVIEHLQEVTAQLAYYMFTVICGLCVHQMFVLPMIYLLFVRKNPYKFLFSLTEPWVMAFVVNSS